MCDKRLGWCHLLGSVEVEYHISTSYRLNSEGCDVVPGVNRRNILQVCVCTLKIYTAQSGILDEGFVIQRKGLNSSPEEAPCLA